MASNTLPHHFFIGKYLPSASTVHGGHWARQPAPAENRRARASRQITRATSPPADDEHEHVDHPTQQSMERPRQQNTARPGAQLCTTKRGKRERVPQKRELWKAKVAEGPGRASEADRRHRGGQGPHPRELQEDMEALSSMAPQRHFTVRPRPDMPYQAGKAPPHRHVSMPPRPSPMPPSTAPQVHRPPLPPIVLAHPHSTMTLSVQKTPCQAGKAPPHRHHACRPRLPARCDVGTHPRRMKAQPDAAAVAHTAQ
ncbi:hypothetical protein BJ912DRAFT_1060955 [Pholiota molesta]|nr:hypothetical protein BJ912DRAFT_1060955 [Pholiota molesta]